ncbi:hypothetical protein [Leptolyngbya sp. NIES-2104]|uniref:hypothetical protein n=1 Tax=Leptolyngbya sp. NIES-2104 TaxID=1552121 RepID=UPI0006ECA998|nr:hypothetical protein [Leptolyngbya sp. NIES-2104]GAP99569.1 hypothetical protein NIES2104_61350 [Leptolyngbya sp. NIES-2104]
MKLVDLPQAVLDDLCQDQQWRLDIDPGFDSKHEFWMAWHHFLKLPEESYFPRSEDSLAEFLTLEGYPLLLPVPRSHHASITPIRLISSADQQTVTLFLQDAYHRDWFTEPTDARYGFLAIADRYQKFGCDFYLASYYHFSYLVGKDYEAAVALLAQKLDEYPNTH